MAEYHLRVPIDPALIAQLRIGDQVLLSGPAFTCRSKLQRYIFDEQHPLPSVLQPYEVLVHAGPIVLADGQGYRLVSFMPTSSLRFEKWGARSIAEWGLKVIVGKTTMGAETMAAMSQYSCVHLSPQSVSPNLWCDSIRIEGVQLLAEMGSIEAPWQLTLDQLGPFVVDMDTTGCNLFDKLDQEIQFRKIEAFEQLGIPQDFRPTRLY